VTKVTSASFIRWPLILMNHSTETSWLTSREAASYLKIEPRTLLMWAREGKVKGFTLSGTSRHVWRFRHIDLDATLTAPSVALDKRRIAMRARQRSGSVVRDKRIKTWNFFWWEHGKRRSKKIGTVSVYPTKARSQFWGPRVWAGGLVI
jgi:excisionase family DNA binding protein